MPVANMGLATTLVSASQYAPLGFKFLELATMASNIGEKVWTYIFNDEAATALAIGDVCVRDPSATTYDMYGVLIAASGTVFYRPFVVGVAQHAIAVATPYGFIQTEGQALVKNGSANITADTGITTGGDRAGACIDYADGATTAEAMIGHSLEAEATDNTTFDAFVSCGG